MQLWTRVLAVLIIAIGWVASSLCAQVMTSTMSGARPTWTERTPGSLDLHSLGQTILHDQICDTEVDGVTSEIRGSILLTEAAADFEVPVGVDWTVETVFSQGRTFRCDEDPLLFNVMIYADSGGRPGRLVYGSQEPPNPVPYGCTSSEVRELPLSSPCHLESGRYWLSVQAIMEDLLLFDQWFVGAYLGSPVGHPAYWRDQTNAFALGCEDWAPLDDCLVAFTEICFALGGQVRPSAERVELVAAVGRAVSGVPGAVFTSLDFPTTSGNGRVGFTGTLNVGAGEEVFVWSDDAVLFRGSEAFPDALSNLEEYSGLGNDGQYLIKVDRNGNPTIRNQNGVLLADNDPAPGLPGRFVRPFIARPRMLSDGTGYLNLSLSDAPGAFPSSSTFYEISPSGVFASLLNPGDSVGGGTLVGSGLTYDVSDSGAHRIHLIQIDTGAETPEAVYLDGAVVLQEGDSAGGLGEFFVFRDCAVNDSGDYAVSGFTDTVANFLVVNGAVAVRDGESMGGVSLPSGTQVRGLSLNNRGQVAHLWRQTSGSFEALFVGDSDRLRESSRLVLRSGETLDSNGDGLGDAKLNGFLLAGSGSWGFNFSDDPFLYALVELEELGTQIAFQAILRVSVPAAASVGSVNGGVGEVVDVLFVNGSSGGRDRKIEVSATDPFAFVLSQGEVESSLNRHVLWVWGGEGRNPSSIVRNGSLLGSLVNPAPFLLGGPKPGFCSPGFLIPQAVSCGSSQIVFLAGPVAPSFRGLNMMGQATTFTIQGLLEDGASGHPTGFSATNAITVVGE